MVGSVVPSSSTRRRIISIDCCTVRVLRAAIASSVTSKTNVCPSVFSIDKSARCSKLVSTLEVTGCAKPCSTEVAFSISSLSRMVTLTPPATRDKPEYPMRSPRKARRISEVKSSKRSRCTVSVSTDSSKCEPPCRSKPRFSVPEGIMSGPTLCLPAR